MFSAIGYYLTAVKSGKFSKGLSFSPSLSTYLFMNKSIFHEYIVAAEITDRKQRPL